MNYAEAVKVVSEELGQQHSWHPGHIKEALAVLRRAEKVMEAVEESNTEWVSIELTELGRTRTGDTPTIRLLRAALDYREERR